MCEQNKIGSIGIDVNHECYSRWDKTVRQQTAERCRVGGGGGALLDSIKGSVTVGYTFVYCRFISLIAKIQ